MEIFFFFFFFFYIQYFIFVFILEHLVIAVRNRESTFIRIGIGPIQQFRIRIRGSTRNADTAVYKFSGFFPKNKCNKLSAMPYNYLYFPDGKTGSGQPATSTPGSTPVPVYFGMEQQVRNRLFSTLLYSR